MTDLDMKRAPVVERARERLKRGLKFESTARQRWIEDYRFAEADSQNGYQWPDKYRKERSLTDRPCLTINKVRTHNLLIINDAKQNKPGISFRPTGNGATFEAAQCWSALGRKIEYQSNATAAYDKATEFQVKAGFGAWRVTTEYEDDESFNQEVYIRPIADPLTVVIDPWATEPDKSDMRWAILFEDLELDEARDKYGRDIDTSVMALDSNYGWLQEDTVRVAEFYEIETEDDELWQITDDSDPANAQEMTVKKSILTPEQKDHYGSHPMTQKRGIRTKTVKWTFIIGNEVVEEKIWPGKQIPIVVLFGEETIIDGVLDRKGHTRALMDPQRMYNYWSSSAVEYGALQTKTPWLSSQEAIDGFEDDWAEQNVHNKAVLFYNALGENGEPIPPPQRIQPPVSAPVALDGMKVAQMEFGLASGQYDASFGQPSNERTGKAINERTRQGEKITYHYTDQLALAVRRTGQIIMEVVPHIYDTKRVVQAMGDDGQSMEVTIDPQAQKLYQETLDQDGKIAQRILNPSKGKFEVYADIGPAYATRREEAFNAFTLILTQAPQLAAIIGDLLMQAGDFPFADVAAQRLRRMVPPMALGQGPTQNEQQMQQQLQELQQLYQKAMEQRANDQLKIKGHAEKRDVEIFNAVTKRLQTFLQHDQFSKGQVLDLIQQALQQAHEVSLQGAQAQIDQDLPAAKSAGQGDVSPEDAGGPPGTGPAGARIWSARRTPVPNGLPPFGGPPPLPGAQLENGQWTYTHPVSGQKFLVRRRQ